VEVIMIYLIMMMVFCVRWSSVNAFICIYFWVKVSDLKRDSL
jgi:hypothetical protein